jgi:hypothetical protein
MKSMQSPAPSLMYLYYGEDAFTEKRKAAIGIKNPN